MTPDDMYYLFWVTGIRLQIQTDMCYPKLVIPIQN